MSTALKVGYRTAPPDGAGPLIRCPTEKIDQPNIVTRENAANGIAEWQHVSNISKAREFGEDKLGRVTDPYTVMSLRLQATFGLRREERIKIRPDWADRSEVLQFKASWTEGGRDPNPACGC